MTLVVVKIVILKPCEVIETYSGEWHVHAPAKGQVYWFVCKFFPKPASSLALASNGFDDWHNCYLIQTYENSEKHRNAMLT